MFVVVGGLFDPVVDVAFDAVVGAFVVEVAFDAVVGAFVEELVGVGEEFCDRTTATDIRTTKS